MKILEELQKQLEMQEMLKRTAESSLHMLKSKLEGKKFELLKMKDPKAAALVQNSQQMNFLASEKLAVSKKQREGTRRGSMDVEPKTPDVSKVKKKKTKKNKSSSPKRKR